MTYKYVVIDGQGEGKVEEISSKGGFTTEDDAKAEATELTATLSKLRKRTLSFYVIPEDQEPQGQGPLNETEA